MKLYEICEQKLKFLNYSTNTSKIYLHYIDEFLEKTKLFQSRISSNDIQNYIDNYKFTSISQQNQVISSIKFLYEKVLNKKYNKINFERPRNERKLPRVIDNPHMLNSINKIKNLKHKAIIALSYSVGLRVSEVINLRIKDIDSKRMIIFVKNSKNKYKFPECKWG